MHITNLMEKLPQTGKAKIFKYLQMDSMHIQVQVSWHTKFSMAFTQFAFLLTFFTTSFFCSISVTYFRFDDLREQDGFWILLTVNRRFFLLLVLKFLELDSLVQVSGCFPAINLLIFSIFSSCSLICIACCLTVLCSSSITFSDSASLFLESVANCSKSAIFFPILSCSFF